MNKGEGMVDMDGGDERNDDSRGGIKQHLRSKTAWTAAWNPLANKGTHVCEDRNSNTYDDDLEHGIDGMSTLSDNSMQAMGAFVLSPEEECIMESEIVRLKTNHSWWKWWVVNRISHCCVIGCKVVYKKTLEEWRTSHLWERGFTMLLWCLKRI